MAVKGWHESSNPGFEEKTVTTDFVPEVMAGQSMSGSNTCSERPPFGAEGSPSEGSALTESLADQGGAVTAIHTALDAPRTAHADHNRLDRDGR